MGQGVGDRPQETWVRGARDGVYLHTGCQGESLVLLQPIFLEALPSPTLRAWLGHSHVSSHYLALSREDAASSEPVT